MFSEGGGMTDMIMTYNPKDSKKGKNIPFDEDEMVKYIMSGEGFRDKPYRDTMGYWTIGYGYKLSDNKDISVWEGDYADGITKEEALELTKGVFKEKIKAFERVSKSKGVDISKMPDDVSTALKMMFYGGSPSDEKIWDAIKAAEKDGYSAASRRRIAQHISRRSEGLEGNVGVKRRMAQLRAMVEGRYDFDRTRANFGNNKWNVYSDSDLYKDFYYENYDYTKERLSGNERRSVSDYKYTGGSDVPVIGSFNPSKEMFQQSDKTIRDREGSVPSSTLNKLKRAFGQ
jgi:GH24 family phage-related lysozyme (muramidase)